MMLYGGSCYPQRFFPSDFWARVEEPNRFQVGHLDGVQFLPPLVGPPTYDEAGHWTCCGGRTHRGYTDQFFAAVCQPSDGPTGRVARDTEPRPCDLPHHFVERGQLRAAVDVTGRFPVQVRAEPVAQSSLGAFCCLAAQERVNRGPRPAWHFSRPEHRPDRKGFNPPTLRARTHNVSSIVGREAYIGFGRLGALFCERSTILHACSVVVALRCFTAPKGRPRTRLPSGTGNHLPRQPSPP